LGCFFFSRPQSDLKLKQFLPLINTSPVFPVIYDASRTVLSLPPIINGSHSAISLDTRDVFIECTATDLHKVRVQGHGVLSWGVGTRTRPRFRCTGGASSDPVEGVEGAEGAR